MTAARFAFALLGAAAVQRGPLWWAAHHSALYTGRLSHRRFAPVTHAFGYRVTLAWLDLAELDQVFRGLAVVHTPPGGAAGWP